MKHEILICFILGIYCSIVFCQKDDDDDDDAGSTLQSQSGSDSGKSDSSFKDTIQPTTSQCWLKLRAPELFDVMERIDGEYAETRKSIQRYFENQGFDQHMLETILINRGASYREITKQKNKNVEIPAGLNLGGICMIRLPDSVLFFHRMKLRNNTAFRINALHNDIENMVIKSHISLSDIHLQGAFERSMTDRDPSALIYAPSYGELHLHLKDAQFKMEGRYKMIKDRLAIEVLISDLTAQDVMLSYVNKATPDGLMPPIKIEMSNLGDFMQRLKTDLSKWVKDYFNDYLIYENLEAVPSISELQKYDKEKAAQLAVFMDNAIVLIKKRIRDIGGAAIRVPKFSIMAAQGLTIKIYDGFLRGLDTMYRRSLATSVLKRENLRNVDAVIGFSDLKVVYKYDISVPLGGPAPPALTGLIILSANELVGHLSLGLLRDPEVVDLDIDFMSRLGPDSMTLEGAANVLVSNFKHVLKHQIATIMSNTLLYGVGMLKSLPRCEPFVPGQLIRRRRPDIIKINDRIAKSEDESDAKGNKLTSREEKESNQSNK